MEFIFEPNRCAAADHPLLGGKGRALAQLQHAGFPVPGWFAVLPGAFEASVTDIERGLLESAMTPEAARRILQHLQPSGPVQAELAQTLARFCPNHELVAVRSSASDEDGPQHSFAGQLESFLFVPPAQVAERIAAVWRSAFSERVFAYHRERGLSRPLRPPTVLIQRMVNAVAAGVAFGVDPVTGQWSVTVVAAVFGLGSSLVSGESDADTYRVERGPNIIERTIAQKRVAHRLESRGMAGICSQALAEAEGNQPALGDDQIKAIAELTRRVSRHFGPPQDIEWAIEDGKLFLLQSRPITSLSRLLDPDGVLSLWDNSNIVESYGGVTTPLTFSFARRAYEEVYRQFCRILRVPATTIAANANTFRCMLGLVRGRIYYNLLNWYRVLALLPGFKVNRRFMEQMMGVKEGLPDCVGAGLAQASGGQRIRDTLNFAISGVALVTNHLRLRSRMTEFQRRLDRALAPPQPRLEEMRPDELAASYLNLERQLLTRWDAPLINDFLAMIFYGLLRRLVEKWCGDTEGTLQNNLLCGEGGMVSAEPARCIREMAQIAAAHPGFADLLSDASRDAVLTAMRGLPDFNRRYHEYLEKFGDRCLDELKLESETLHDNPMILLRSIGQFARRFTVSKGEPGGEMDAEVRRSAQARVSGILQRHPIRRGIFRWVLRHARARVRDRENLRFERTRLFGRVRRVFVELGHRFHALGLVASPRDIFYLEVGEVLGFIDGTASCVDLNGLVAVRKAEFARYREMEPPANRFETHGMVNQGNRFTQTSPTPPSATGDQRKGIGCCPGIVRGPVRLVRDPARARLQPGDILVAERTDPGWIMIFPFAQGLLVERGSLLSHSAIVARELGIPAIVAIDGITRWLKDGDWVELDGSTGIVRKIGPAR
jgi:phosphohistidine swiveling domain-containing protein